MQKPNYWNRLEHNFSNGLTGQRKQQAENLVAKWHDASEGRCAMALEGLCVALQSNIDRLNILDRKIALLDAQKASRKDLLRSKKMLSRHGTERVKNTLRAIATHHRTEVEKCREAMLLSLERIEEFRVLLFDQIASTDDRGHHALAERYAKALVHTRALFEGQSATTIESEIEEVAHAKAGILSIWEPVRASIRKLILAGQQILPALQQTITYIDTTNTRIAVAGAVT